MRAFHNRLRKLEEALAPKGDGCPSCPVGMRRVFLKKGQPKPPQERCGKCGKARLTIFYHL